ncbi:MAG: MarR family winged helix-turn-helix transcriptional regulator [Candidatus Bilamarchaeaceae archaeon]
MGILLRSKPASVFLFLKGREQAYLSEIANETGTTYVYITNLVASLEAKGLVMAAREGRKKMVKLTEKGREVANLAEEIKRRFADTGVPGEEQRPPQG